MQISKILENQSFFKNKKIITETGMVLIQIENKIQKLLRTFVCDNLLKVV